MKRIDGWLLAILLLTALCAAMGLFYPQSGSASFIQNAYGDPVELYGKGLYAHDSYFKASIFRGTDFSMLVAVLPALLFAWRKDRREADVYARIFLLSVASVILYYGMSMAFGVFYNMLFLVYLLLFSISLLLFMFGMLSLNLGQIDDRLLERFPTKGMTVFLVLSAVSLFVAWLPDILQALAANHSLGLQAHYTTEITYIIDMGIISPLILYTLFLLRRKSKMGYVLLQVWLMLSGLIGITVASQSLFNYLDGIEFPLPVLLTKSATFIMMAGFAFYFQAKLMREQTTLKTSKE